MTSTDSSYGDEYPATTRLSPAIIRDTTFPMAPRMRNGYRVEDVHRFMDRIAADLSSRDAAEAELRAEAASLKDALKNWQSRQSRWRQSAITLHPAQEEAVNLLSAAQQQADATVAQAQDYSRQIVAQARRQANEALAQAHARAEAEAQHAVDVYRQQAGEQYTKEAENLERRLAQARSFLDAIGTAEFQLKTARQALSAEVQRLGGEHDRSGTGTAEPSR